MHKSLRQLIHYGSNLLNKAKEGFGTKKTKKKISATRSTWTWNHDIYASKQWWESTNYRTRKQNKKGQQQVAITKSTKIMQKLKLNTFNIMNPCQLEPHMQLVPFGVFTFYQLLKPFFIQFNTNHSDYSEHQFIIILYNWRITSIHYTLQKSCPSQPYPQIADIKCHVLITNHVVITFSNTQSLQLLVMKINA